MLSFQIPLACFLLFHLKPMFHSTCYYWSYYIPVQFHFLFLGDQSTFKEKLIGTINGTRRFLLSAKRTSPFKSAGASLQSTTDSRGVRISGSNAGYTIFRGSVKSTGYPLHSPVSPSLPLPCVTVCHHISTGLYNRP
jgi:hypothetical protein